MAEQEGKNQSHPEGKKPFFSTGINSAEFRHNELMLKSGDQINYFRIEEELGHGASGTVYLAYDPKLERNVAIKCISGKLKSDTTIRSFYQREAQILASLNHPNIATIYEIYEESDGTGYLIMEYVPGVTLAEKISKGAIHWKEALLLGQKIAEAISVAHEHGVIHRDLKPGNIKITEDGQVKVLDFGIAKTPRYKDIGEEDTIYKPGRLVGTPAYMSPEQARGEPSSESSDIWSFGCILFEMISGNRPFSGQTSSDVIASILKTEPQLDNFPKKAPSALRVLIRKCLEKYPAKRYQTAKNLCQDLQKCIKTYISSAVNIRAIFNEIRKPKFIVPGLLVLITIFILGYYSYQKRAKIHWAKNEAVPNVMKLIEQEQYFDAFLLAQKAESYIPNNQILESLWPQMCLRLSVDSTPSQADIFYKNYSSVASDWIYLGTSPLMNIRLPLGHIRWKIEKKEYTTVEAVSLINRNTKSLAFTMYQKGEIPGDMVPIPGGEFSMSLTGFSLYDLISLDSFFMDRYEVANKAFKEFVDSGGYDKREYWEHTFIKEGRAIPWEEAKDDFHDLTGYPGPANWENGNYPKGKEDYPVNGISWYEAAAYAKFKGKYLPTIYHWCRAASANRLNSAITSLSNFGDKGTTPVGSMSGLGFYGTYDMAGNVREWCYNIEDEKENKRYILGGAWGEPEYMFISPAILSSLDRSLKNGFRCISYPKIIPKEKTRFLTAQRNLTVRDLSKVKPISDSEFDLIRKTHFSYDKRIPFETELQNYDDSSKLWRKEKVTINAAYNNERLSIYIFSPKGNSPPFPGIIEFSGGGALEERSSDNISPNILYLQRGWAQIFPIYEGMYERGPIQYDYNTLQLPISEWVKDWERTIDYLETRSDIDTERLAYSGVSLGACMGTYLSAMERQRFKACILEQCGIPTWLKPLFQYDPVNFLPRIHIPVLMINGQFDPLFPYETSQKPMFDLIGTPIEHKHHLVISEGEHGGWVEKKYKIEPIKFLESFLDK